MAKKPDVLEIRRANLRILLAQWGGPTSLAKKLHLAGPSYLSQLIAGSRPITEKTARKFEEVLGLPSGWLDVDQDNQKSKPARVEVNTVASVVRLVGEVLEEVNLRLPPAKVAEIVVMVYEEQQHTGQLDEHYVRKLIKLLR